ncbi:ClpXP protease specificity-enhancing factor [Noviherbaspirillum pedocola]|uniref:ClpXP protease specificity-enhancing factor n=1 Tax=Noviherbaspirillum pedocola TaxID=2801341 RepID=A0A934SW34_9BURK|nr:ClpXP protease specificity-enhancing factor [Noviherbaspirillum pedocola]MBK4733769.1 ClpXP protease specificity-enhancing factor [Noviherbaspirillum pedocola]
MQETSTKPYLLRAIYEWCTDNGYTPYLAAMVDKHTQVPLEFVKNNEIVLNISFSATSGLKMGNDFISFHARFAGVSREIFVPVDNVVAIYARENGQGMAFEVTRKQDAADAPAPAEAPSLSAVPAPSGGEEQTKGDDGPEDHPEPPKKGGRPTLTRIK